MPSPPLSAPHVSDQSVYLFDTLLMSFLKEAVHFERCSPWVDLSMLSLVAFILLPPFGVDVLRCPPVISQSSEEKPESDEKALPATAAGSDGPAPMLEEVDVSEVSAVSGILEGLPKVQWQGGPPAAALSMLNEDNSSPWPESSLLDLDDELVLTYQQQTTVLRNQRFIAIQLRRYDLIRSAHFCIHMVFFLRHTPYL